NVGSLTRTLAEALARELAVLRKQLELVYRSGFVDTAEGSALDKVVALLAVTRKSREFAAGSVRFFRDTPAPADIFIPQGTRVSTALNPPVSFVTITDKTLRRGQLSVMVDVRAETKGSAGVVAEKSITVLNQTILGISGVINDAPTLFGNTAESDIELRARAKKVIERIGKATPRAIISALTGIAGLKENDIKVVEELQLRPGVVKVYIARQLDAELAGQVQEAILNTRAAGIRIEDNLAIALQPAPQDNLPMGDARDEGSIDEEPPEEEFQLPLNCEVMVFPENPRLTAAEKDTMEKAIRESIIAYVNDSTIGGVLVYNRMVANIMAIGGVLDIVLQIEVKGVGSGKRNVDVPEGRRAVIEDAEKDILINFAGAPINFDFYLQVTAKNGNTLTTIQKEIKDKLVEFFATNPQVIKAADLISKLAVSELYILNIADLSWTAEYEQAGLFVREQGGEQAETAIPVGDRVVLRDVKVVLKTE
ncbi:MAG: baseplate J/gp47 family protein, partial [Acidobacteriota bacterium]